MQVIYKVTYLPTLLNKDVVPCSSQFWLFFSRPRPPGVISYVHTVLPSLRLAWCLVPNNQRH